MTDPIPVAARSKVWVFCRLFASWDCRLEFRRRHGCLSFVNVVYRQVQVSATGRGILPSVVCLSVFFKPQQSGQGAQVLSSHKKNARGGLARGYYTAPSYDETQR